jgi:hypothetical protein
VSLFASVTHAAALYYPGQTLDPSCSPTNPDCTVNTSTFPTITATSTTATSTFAGPITENGIFTFGGITGSTQCLHVDASGVVSGTGSDCGAVGGGSGTVNSGTAGQVAFYNSTGTAVSGTSTITFANGNVGIGTTSPVAKLAVDGDGYFGGDLTAANITATGTLTTDGVLTANANVTNLGVGADSQINFGAQQGYIKQVSTLVTIGAEGQDVATFGKNTGLSVTKGGIIIQNNTGSYKFGSSADTSLNRLSAGVVGVGSSGTTDGTLVAGNVGIGTTTPSNALEVAGDGYFSGNLTTTGTVTASSTIVNGNMVIPYGSKLVYGSNSTWDYLSDTFLGNSLGHSFTIDAAGTLSLKGGRDVNSGINFYTGTGSAQRMTIGSNGSVGIGTTSPISTLAVVGTTTTSGLTISNLANTTLAVDANGNVIATTTTGGGTNYFSNSGATTTLTTGSILSTAGLAVTGTATSTFAGDLLVSGNIVPSANNTYSLGLASSTWKDVFVGPGSIYVNGQEVLHTDPSHNVNLSADLNQDIIVQTSGTGDIQLNPSGTGNILLKGNVQLYGGKTFTTSDGSALLFSDGLKAGNISITGNDIIATTTNGSINLAANGLGAVYVSNGNFGIGTTSPGSALTVNGDVNFTGALKTNGAAGSNGYILQSTGSGVQWVATSSLGIGGSSVWSTSGSNAYYTTGNVGIGTTTPSNALDVNGAINASTNYYYQNTSLVYANISSDNWFLAGSGASNPGGTDNLAIGIGALSPTAGIGNQNIAIGHNAAGGSKVGSANVVVGYNAMQASNSANATNNTAIGVTALRDLLNASNNTAVGFQALLHNQTGADNIALGSQVGTALLSGSNNILIGNSIDATSTSSSNMLNIGNLIYGTGLYSSTGHVGIGTTSPVSALAVVGTTTTSGLTISNLTNTALAVDANGNVIATTTSGGSSVWSTSGSNAYYTTGNVGIGTSSPSNRLEVSGNTFLGGNVTATGTLTVGANSTSTAGFYFDPSVGKAGITSDHVAIKPATTYTVCSATSKGKSACDFTGDGVNDQNAIQAAINACPVTGCKISLLEGSYYINNSIVPKNNVWLDGAGASSTVLYGMSGLDNKAIVEKLGVPASPQYNIEISNMGFDGTNMPRTTYKIPEKAIYITYVVGLKIHDTFSNNIPATCIGTDSLVASQITNNYMQYCGTAGQGDSNGSNGIGIGTSGTITAQATTTSEPNVISGNVVYATANKGIMVEGQSANNGAVGYVISNNVAYGGRIGFGVAGTNYTILSNNQAYNNSAYGIEVVANSYSGDLTDHVTIVGNNIYTNGSHGIYVPDASTTDVDIKDNTVANNGGNGIYAGAFNVTMQNNTVQSNALNGIYYENHKQNTYTNIVMQNNHILSNGTAGISGSNQGIKFMENSAGMIVKNILITGNHITDSSSTQTQNYGIDFEGNTSGYKNVVISGNDVSGNISSGLFINTGRINPSELSAFNNIGYTVSTLAGTLGIGTSTPSSSNSFEVAGNTFLGGNLTATGTLTLSGITGSTQCLHVDASGVVSGTGSDCGAGGSSFWTQSGATTTNTVANVVSTFGVFGSIVATSSTSTLQGLVLKNLSNTFLAVDANGNVIATTTPGGGGSTSPGGASSTIQFNANGSFSGNSNFVFDGANLGIGTSSPNDRLVVSSASGAANIDVVNYDKNNTSGISFVRGTKTDSSTDWNIYNQTGVLNFDSESSGVSTNRFSISTSGFFGFGTTSPKAQIHIAGNHSSGFATIELEDTNPASGVNFMIGNGFKGSGGTLDFAVAPHGTTPTSANVFMSFDSSGHVGIGTTSPISPLSVNGSGYFGGDLTATGTLSVTSTTGTSTIAGSLDVGNGLLSTNYSSGVTSISSLNTGALNFDTDAGVISWTDLPLSSAASSTVESYSAQIAGNPVLTVYGLSDGAGNANNLRVGIGSTTPSATLGLEGTFAVNSPGATSTITGNLDVAGNVHGTNVYSGDLIFANDFHFTEASTTASTTPKGLNGLYLTNQKQQSILSIDEQGNLSVKGDVCANGTDCYGATIQTLTNRLQALASSTAQASASTSATTASLLTAQTAAQLSLGDLSTALVTTNGFVTTNKDRIDSLATTISSLAASTTFVATVASSSATTLASSTSFVSTIASAVKDVISTTGEWIVSKITATLAIFDTVQTKSLETQTATVDNGIQMTDTSTGQIYCLRITNGNITKYAGTCAATASSTPVMTTTTNTANTTTQNTNTQQTSSSSTSNTSTDTSSSTISVATSSNATTTIAVATSTADTNVSTSTTSISSSTSSSTSAVMTTTQSAVATTTPATTTTTDTTAVASSTTMVNTPPSASPDMSTQNNTSVSSSTDTLTPSPSPSSSPSASSSSTASSTSN